MLYILAHELRGPLTPIRYAAAALSLHNAAGTPTRKAAELIERQLSSIESIIENVLDAARLHRDLAPVTCTRINLGAAVAKAVEAVAPYVAERGHELRCACAATPILVDADAEQIGQIVGNLVTNAAKYTDRGGRIEICTTAAGDTARISVRDTGIGLSAGKLLTIFDLYAQAGQSRSARSAGGLGIGLYVAHQLAVAHGGTLTASSRGLNRGSEFTVSLPLAAT